MCNCAGWSNCCPTVGSRTKSNEEEVQYHYRSLITLKHSIINSVSRPPGLFTWDWKVFALGLPDWLCRPSAGSSPELRFVFFFLFFFLSIFIFFFSLWATCQVYSTKTIHQGEGQHLCHPLLLQRTGHWYQNGISVSRSSSFSLPWVYMSPCLSTMC